MGVKIKICCIASLEEAQMALAAGADALGLVSAMPSGPGVIGDDTIAAIARRIAPPAASVLLTSRVAADAIADQAEAAGVDIVQIVAPIDPACYPRLRARLPGRRLMQVIHVEDASALDLARAYSRAADALLLDSGRPGAAELGGTGRIHDWRVSAEIVASLCLPVYLAGGLDAGNVGEAIRAVRPCGVDICTGVRTDGRLDAAKLAAFAAAVANA